MSHFIGNNQEDAELAILEKLYASTNRSIAPKQRDLASVAGASLGMTNAILKRLAQKGLIIVRRLNSRNVQYAVTPDGVNEIARRSYRYFKRTIKNIVFYRDRIDEAIAAAKRRGRKSILLVGASDLDFIVEHACLRHELSFLAFLDPALIGTPRGEQAFTIFGEGIASPATDWDVESMYLAAILYGKP